MHESLKFKMTEESKLAGADAKNKEKNQPEAYCLNDGIFLVPSSLKTDTGVRPKTQKLGKFSLYLVHLTIFVKRLLLAMKIRKF